MPAIRAPFKRKSPGALITGMEPLVIQDAAERCPIASCTWQVRLTTQFLRCNPVMRGKQETHDGNNRAELPAPQVVVLPLSGCAVLSVCQVIIGHSAQGPDGSVGGGYQGPGYHGAGYHGVGGRGDGSGIGTVSGSG